MRPLGSGGTGASAALALLDDEHRHRLRRAAWHLPPVALGTRPLPILGRAPKRATEGSAGVLDSTSRSPTKRNVVDMPTSDAAVEAS
jgi:hypothetical protein